MRYLQTRVLEQKSYTMSRDKIFPEIADYVVTALHAAYAEALQAYDRDEVPIGAVMVMNGQIIAADHNRVIERHDPTAHAELLVIQKSASLIQNERLVDCELFTTLEPCSMCSGAIVMARIPRVYFIATDEKLPGLRSILTLPGHNHTPELHSMGDLDIPASDLLKKFFKRKRD